MRKLVSMERLNRLKELAVKKLPAIFLKPVKKKKIVCVEIFLSEADRDFIVWFKAGCPLNFFEKVEKERLLKALINSFIGSSSLFGITPERRAAILAATILWGSEKEVEIYKAISKQIKHQSFNSHGIFFGQDYECSLYSKNFLEIIFLILHQKSGDPKIEKRVERALEVVAIDSLESVRRRYRYEFKYAESADLKAATVARKAYSIISGVILKVAKRRESSKMF